MKLEDIELQMGDKITFKNGEFNYLDRDYQLDWKTWNKDNLVKIERYVWTGYYGDGKHTYTLETIWERKEILDEKEKEIVRILINNIELDFNSIIKREHNYFAFKGINYTECTPNFKKELFKNMEVDKEYSLEELGL